MVSTTRPFLTRCRLRNYRSIAACDVLLGALTFLVGPNGSGKSNFLDALRLSTDALRTSMEQALHERGGIAEVRRRSAGHPTDFGVALELELPEGRRAAWAFEVGAVRDGGFRIKRERCQVKGASYEIQEGKIVHAPAAVSPPASVDRLYLIHAAGLEPFRPVYEALTSAGFYNIQPGRVSAFQIPDQGELLHRDGGNLASVLRRMGRDPASAGALERIKDFLQAIVPGLEGVEAVQMGHLLTLEFRQVVAGAQHAWRFPAITMSDGTLRALAVLVALFQPASRGGAPLIGIEEPEVALHPAAAGVLFDALRAATRHTQVIVTSHSPDLLDHPELDPESIRAVIAHEGQTLIGPVNEASRSALLESLYSGGELLRAGMLTPEPGLPPQLQLFEAWEIP